MSPFPRTLLMGALALLLSPFAPMAAAAPSQVHLSQPEGAIVVQWAIAGDARSLPAGRVDFGPTALYGSSVPGQMVGYVDATPYLGTSSASMQRDLVEAPATLYRAQLPPMDPGTTFHYRVVDGVGIPTGEIVATTLPGPTRSARILAYGDQGTTEDGTALPPDHQPEAIVDLALAQDPDVVLVAGDLSYAEEAALRWWNQWFDIIEPLASTRPFFAAVGNHDRDFVTGYDQWTKRFGYARDEQNYAFDAGPVHVLVVNSQEACLEGESTETVQRANPGCQVSYNANVSLENTAITDFMKADLADARARGMPWTIVMFHHPPYSHGEYNESSSSDDYMTWMRQNWVPIFEENGVDLVITGHDHDYQRSWPVLANESSPGGSRYREGEGIVYVVTGGGGRPPYDLSPPPMPEWFATGASLHHVVVLDASPTKLRVQTVALDGSTIDSFEVRKPGGPPTQLGLGGLLALSAFVGVGARHALRRGVSSDRRSAP